MSTRAIVWRKAWRSRAGLTAQCYEGVLSKPAEPRPLPFEVIFETPQTFPAVLQASAGTAALRAIVKAYCELIAYGQNL